MGHAHAMHALHTGGNRLRESLQLFAHMMRGEELKDKSVVLFFNKSDLLKAKLAAGRSVKEHFPEYVHLHTDFANSDVGVSTDC